MHYGRWQKNGEPGEADLRKSPADASIVERIARIGWDEIVRVPELGACHEWRGARDARGYGYIGLPGGGTSVVHRAAYEAEHGEIQASLLVCHRCDNPPCINDEHHFLGTHEDNTADMVAKGRDMHGVNSFTSKLTEEQVREIRARATTERVLQRELAVEYGVSRATIGRVITGRSFRLVE